MGTILDTLFNTAGFLPHGVCLSWLPELLLLHLSSDLLMGASYLSVAASIHLFARRRPDLDFAWMLHVFAVVFGLCGIAHFAAVAVLWIPHYTAQALFKLATALPSVGAAVLLWRLLPRALVMPTPDELRRINHELENEIAGHQATFAALRTAKERAETASRAKSDFLATMSHELRTPLNAIIGFSEALETRLFGPLNDRQQDYIGCILRSGQHLLRIINDILDISKIDAGKLTLDEGMVDVSQVIAAGVVLVRGRAEEKAITVAVDLPPALPLLRGDELRLKQILVNLLSNAVKFTPEGGRVTVRAAPDPKGGLVLEVSDTGIGMRAEDIPRALEMFSQIDTSLSRKFDGTGIGLPLTRALAELHGGRLDIRSAEGKGTSVSVALPPERVLET